jgi:hypothetical protein
MIVISNFEVTKGYEVWKKAFESNEAMRQKNNVKVIAYGQLKVERMLALITLR